MRFDGNVLKGAENYQQLLAYLESKCRKPTLVGQFEDLSLLRYE
jgi:hypothetical protein